MKDNNHPQRPKTEQDCVSTPLLRRISDHLGKAMCDLSPEEVRVWIRENFLEDQKLFVEESPKNKLCSVQRKSWLKYQVKTTSP